jgi:hypothetical protein
MVSMIAMRGAPRRRMSAIAQFYASPAPERVRRTSASRYDRCSAEVFGFVRQLVASDATRREGENLQFGAVAVQEHSALP